MRSQAKREKNCVQWKISGEEDNKSPLENQRMTNKVAYFSDSTDRHRDIVFNGGILRIEEIFKLSKSKRNRSVKSSISSVDWKGRGDLGEDYGDVCYYFMVGWFLFIPTVFWR